MKMQDHSRTSFLQFLDYLGAKGLMNKNTVSSAKGAASSLLSILEEDEAVDLRKIDLDMVANRFVNLKGSKYPPETLRVYKQRTSKALSDFIRYKENPAGFRVTSPSTKEKSKGTDPARKSPPPSASNIGTSKQSSIDGAQETATLNVPVALRTGCIIHINGIPADLTHSEAKKIANVIMAMSSEETK
jgi:hypothetical protein